MDQIPSVSSPSLPPSANVQEMPSLARLRQTYGLLASASTTAETNNNTSVNRTSGGRQSLTSSLGSTSLLSSLSNSGVSPLCPQQPSPSILDAAIKHACEKIQSGTEEEKNDFTLATLKSTWIASHVNTPQLTPLVPPNLTADSQHHNRERCNIKKRLFQATPPPLSTELATPAQFNTQHGQSFYRTTQPSMRETNIAFGRSHTWVSYAILITPRPGFADSLVNLTRPIYESSGIKVKLGADGYQRLYLNLPLRESTMHKMYAILKQATVSTSDEEGNSISVPLTNLIFITKVMRYPYSINSEKFDQSSINEWLHEDELDVEAVKQSIIANNPACFPRQQDLKNLHMYPATPESTMSQAAVFKIFVSEETYNFFLRMHDAQLIVKPNLTLSVYTNVSLSLCEKCILPYHNARNCPNEARCKHCELPHDSSEHVHRPRQQRKCVNCTTYATSLVSSSSSRSRSTTRSTDLLLDDSTDLVKSNLHEATDSICPWLRAHKDKIRASRREQARSGLWFRIEDCISE